MKEFNDVSINENNEEKKEEKNKNLPKMTFDWRTDEWPKAFDVQNRMRVLGYTSETQSVVIDILVKMNSLKNLGLTTSDDEEMMGKANEVLNIALSEKPTFTNEGLDDLFTDAYSFLDTFNDYTDLKSFEKDNNKEIKEEPKKEDVVNDEAPKNEMPPIKNDVEDVADEDFEIEDPTGNFPVHFIAKKKDQAPISLLYGFEDEERSLQDKRNMMFSYVMQGMTKKEITENIHKIQNDKNLSNLFDEYAKVVDKNDIVNDRQRLKDTMTFKMDGLSINGKVLAVKRKKGLLKDSNSGAYVENDLQRFNRELKEFQEREKQNEVQDAKQDIEIIPKMVADYYIEQTRDKDFPITNPSELSYDKKEFYIRRFLEILAIRQLANSERGKVDKLIGFQFTQEELADRVEEMKEDSVFKGFIKKLREEPEYMKKAILAAKANPGHGGKLDDMLKDYMLNLPPGELRNSKLHDRFLPNIKERIESIQEQYKRATRALKELDAIEKALGRIQVRGGSDKQIERYTEKRAKLQNLVDEFSLPKAVAEIIALRNYAHADLGKKSSLNKKVPSFEEDKLDDLTSVYNDEGFEEICKHEAVAGMLTMGHAGNMTALVRELALDRKIEDKDINALLEKNTIGYHLDHTLKEEAGTLSNRLKDGIESESPFINKMVEDGKMLIMEYMHLTMKVWNSDYKNVDKELLIKDVPWGEMENMKRKGLDYDKDIKSYLENFKPDDVAGLLDVMNKGIGPKNFIKQVKTWKESLEPARKINNNNMRPNNNDIKIGGKNPIM